MKSFQSLLKLYEWQVFALGSAFFASLTAIFGKIGVSQLNSNLATFIRTVAILGVTGAIVTLRGEWQRPDVLSNKAMVFLLLSALATGFSWLCYYRALQIGEASRVAPVDKLSVVFTMLIAVTFLGEKASWNLLVGGGLVTAGALVLALS